MNKLESRIMKLEQAATLAGDFIVVIRRFLGDSRSAPLGELLGYSTALRDGERILKRSNESEAQLKTRAVAAVTLAHQDRPEVFGARLFELRG